MWKPRPSRKRKDLVFVKDHASRAENGHIGLPPYLSFLWIQGKRRSICDPSMLQLWKIGTLRQRKLLMDWFQFSQQRAYIYLQECASYLTRTRSLSAFSRYSLKNAGPRIINDLQVAPNIDAVPDNDLHVIGQSPRKRRRAEFRQVKKIAKENSKPSKKAKIAKEDPKPSKKSKQKQQQTSKYRKKGERLRKNAIKRLQVLNGVRKLRKKPSSADPTA